MMASIDNDSVHVGVVMVGPAYLHNGAKLCGRRTSRTCIFLLVTFGAALTMIGLVFLTADLRMQSGLWAAGVVFILFGVMMLMWFTTLCCAARRTFNALPASHPARSKASRTILMPAQSSSTYQLLPLAQNPSQEIPTMQARNTNTLPHLVTHRPSVTPQPSEYYSTLNNHQTKVPRHNDVQPGLHTWGYSTGLRSGYNAQENYTPDAATNQYNLPYPLTTHTLSRPYPLLQQNRFREPAVTLPSNHYTPVSHVRDDSPPPYHTVVSSPQH